MRFIQVASVLAMTLALSSCTRTLTDDSSQTLAPAPLTAQPVSPVQAGALPDPSTNTAQFPSAPAANTQIASAANDAAAAASALDVTKESMVGNWKVSAAGASCDMFLTLTNLGSGSRGGTRGCVGEIKAMGSWEVSGKQVLLKGRDDNVVGKVYKTADSKFDGTTASGQSLTLSR